MTTELTAVTEIALVGVPSVAALDALVAKRQLKLSQLSTLEEALALELDGCLVVVATEGPTMVGAVAMLEQLLESGASAIVLVCESPRAWELRTVLLAGASGVVLVDELDAALVPCVEAVLADQVCVPRRHSSQVEPPALSAREKQVLGLVVMGQTNGQIADRLFVAESTVKSHLSSAFGKLGVRSRNEAVDLILDPDRGFGMGILGLSVEQVP